jgi:OFA family oxalate/formate antiporter-like MFS transporter
VKWFPDKKGLITGLSVAGFGAGAFFFAPLAKGLISGVPYELLGVKLFPLPELEVFNTFMALGIIFLVAVVAGAQILRNPPAGFVPKGWSPPKPAHGAPAKVDFTPTEMLKLPTFWLLWLTYFAGCTAGLQVIMKASPIWQSFAFGSLTPPIAESEFQRVTTAGAMAVSILAIFNSLGRILWGKISDTIGRKITLVAMFLICGAIMLVLNSMQTWYLRRRIVLWGISCVISGGYGRPLRN